MVVLPWRVTPGDSKIMLTFKAVLFFSLAKETFKWVMTHRN